MTKEKLTVTTGALPASRKIYVDGVAMREISLSGGEKPVTVYDTSGAYSDANAKIDIYAGLPKLRADWIMARGDVEAYAGREVKPEDNGLTGASRGAAVEEFPNVNKMPIRAKAGKSVTQLTYARAGIITKEMEYIATRENEGRQLSAVSGQEKSPIKWEKVSAQKSLSL